MAEHRIKKNNIIYIIPDDELFRKLKNDEAFIDDYGRLMNRKPHRVLKELRHYVDETPIAQRVVSTDVRERSSYSLADSLKESAKLKAMEVGEDLVNRAVDAVFYEVLPNVWYEHVVPLYHRAKESITSKRLKPDCTPSKEIPSDEMIVKQQSGSRMTQQEADAEKRKVLYHWIAMLNSLKKLHDAGEMDFNSTIVQLTDPALLERVNSFLNENPNLLETDKYLLLHRLLGRDIYVEQQLIPIRAEEITKFAESYGNIKDNERGSMTNG